VFKLAAIAQPLSGVEQLIKSEEVLTQVRQLRPSLEVAQLERRTPLPAIVTQVLAVLTLYPEEIVPVLRKKPSWQVLQVPKGIVPRQF